jgi:lysophospholipase L1-like esterase
MITCFGDSITAGVPGVAYCDFLEKDGLKLFRDGLGGDTAAGLLGRLSAFMTAKAPEDPVFVFEIGTNDILLPFLETWSENWEKTIRGIRRKGRIIAKDKSEFLETYEKILEKTGPAPVLVISIPCIGEDLTNEPNRTVDDYNRGLRELCTRFGKTLIDFNGRQKEIIRGAGLKDPLFISKNSGRMVADIIVTRNPAGADRLSEKRNLTVTMDGVHLNSRGARALAEMIKAHLPATFQTGDM